MTRSSEVRNGIPVHLLEMLLHAHHLSALIRVHLPAATLLHHLPELLALQVFDTVGTDQTSRLTGDDVSAVRLAVSELDLPVLVPPEPGLAVAVVLHLRIILGTLTGGLKKELMLALLGRGVVVQVLAEVAVERTVADGAAGWQVQLVLVVVNGVDALFAVCMETIGLAVGTRDVARVVAVAGQTLVLVVVALAGDGVEVVRVERRGRAVRLPAFFLAAFAFAIENLDLGFALTAQLGATGSFLFLFLLFILGVPVVAVRVGAAEVVEFTDFELLLLGGVGNLAMTLVAHVRLHGINVRARLAAHQALVQLEHASPERTEQTLQINEVLLLGNEHAVYPLHVGSVESGSGGLVVAEQALLEEGGVGFGLGRGSGSGGLFGLFAGSSVFHGVILLVLVGGREMGVGGTVDGRDSILDLGLLDTLNNLVELLLGIGIDLGLGLRSGLAQRESRAHNRANLVVGLGASGGGRGPGGQSSGPHLVVLAADVVLVRVLAEVGLGASFAGHLKASLVCLRGNLSAGLENLFGEDLGGDGREGSDTALEVIATRGQGQSSAKIEIMKVVRNNILPVTAHMALLQVDVAESDLTGVAREGMGGSVVHRRDIGGHGGRPAGGNSSHFGSVALCGWCCLRQRRRSCEDLEKRKRDVGLFRRYSFY